ncbi:transglutaminase family protein [Granulicella sp. WH15]|uniref:transglutaminase-like domain-containing protein n=1 Tax=Granulicella sp. WH15 TaxID=2602070 RepID=UPI00136743D2|nr:transglutaminase family protein [Granulicella sp. WH15]QHN04153.1 transglutaminase family protein [Granulicella sp. WH15]
MLIRSEFAIDFHLPRACALVAMLRLHPSLDPRVRVPEVLAAEHVDSDTGEKTPIAVEEYLDRFGNRCSRFLAPEGGLRLTGGSVTEQESVPDPIHTAAVQHQVEELPTDVLEYLLSSRYCQVDALSQIAGEMFGHTTPGWARAIWIRDWVHDHVRFDYKTARPTKTALDVFTERVGVCRDFQHLAITMTRAMNIPARYVTGYLGDIRRPYSGAGDFSAWYEVFLDNRWWTMDARHNDSRMGRVLMATGRDATDVAITTSFGVADVTNFYVESYEVDEHLETVPLPGGGVRNQPWIRT